MGNDAQPGGAGAIKKTGSAAKVAKRHAKKRSRPDSKKEMTARRRKDLGSARFRSSKRINHENFRA
jgi:hypothetical protein